MPEQLARWLTDAGVAFDMLEHAPVRTSEEAARVRGTRLDEGAKALVVRAGERYVHCVLPAHRRADNAALRAILGTRTLRFATPEELLELTGCAPGAVPPFGNLFGLPVYVDEELTTRERIAFNAGSHTVSITMRADDFVRLSGATVCRFARA
ncbi:MAG TPA: YbaK/EbsC family protein [Methylomirabilota bacterium]|nr:YbaK/EbsC family protein [Methylomirabilota bacterium]